MSNPTGVAPDGSPVALYLKLPGEAEAAFVRSHIPESRECSSSAPEPVASPAI